MILPVFAFIQKKKRKSTLKAWGFRNPKGEGIDIVISLLGTFIIFCLSRYIYRGSWFPFSDSFNILSFLALIPLCIISEVTQEIGFRGMVQAEAMDRLGRWRGVIFASFIFTLFHLSKLIRYIIYLPFLWQSTYCPYCPSAPLYVDWRSFLIEYTFYFFFCFLYGFLWGYLYSKNRNLTSPIVGHIFANTLCLMFGC
jgi:membrane protease YdiL (CAAX protease family)